MSYNNNSKLEKTDKLTFDIFVFCSVFKKF